MIGDDIRSHSARARTFKVQPDHRGTVGTAPPRLNLWDELRVRLLGLRGTNKGPAEIDKMGPVVTVMRKPPQKRRKERSKRQVLPALRRGEIVGDLVRCMAKRENLHLIAGETVRPQSLNVEVSYHHER